MVLHPRFVALQPLLPEDWPRVWPLLSGSILLCHPQHIPSSFYNNFMKGIYILQLVPEEIHNNCFLVVDKLKCMCTYRLTGILIKKNTCTYTWLCAKKFALTIIVAIITILKYNEKLQDMQSHTK